MTASTNGHANGHPAKLQFWNIEPAPGSCPWAQRAWIALEELDVSFDANLVNKGNKSQAFQDLYFSVWPDKQATSKVPVIVDTDGTKLTESAVVVEYLDAKYGPKLIPKDPATAARARLFVDVFQASVQKPAGSLSAVTTAKQLADAKQALTSGLQVLEQYISLHGSKEGPFFLGSQFSIAEVNTAPFVKNISEVLPVYRQISILELAKELSLPRVAAWLQAVVDRPSTQKTSLPRDLKVKLFQPYYSQIKD